MRGKLFVARIAGVAAVVAVVLAATAAPASAHTISGPRPSNFRSRVVSIAPATPGISLRVVDLGSKLELTNRTGADVMVLGYLGEAYLRVGPSGVYENVHSQATYLNRTRNGATIPPDIDTSPTAAPEWRKIGDGNAVRWHDHRIHWMGSQLPPQVASDPASFHHLSVQSVQLVVGGTPVVARVALDWVPGPSGLPWIPLIAGLFALGLVAALLPGWYRVLAALLALLVLADVAHAIAYELPRPGSNGAKTVQFLGGSFVSIIVWGAGVATIIGVLRRRAEALYGVVVVGLMVALIGGATDLSALWKSQLPNAGPGRLTRAEVALSLGLGAGMAVGAIVRMVRSGRAARSERSGGRWLSLLVVGLDDAELARIAGDLDADEVLEVAMRELAIRLGPVAPDLSDGALVFDIAAVARDTGEEQQHEWSLEQSGPEEVRAVRGRAAGAACELHVSFPACLQLLAGTATLADARADGRAACRGDATILERVAPYLAERDVIEEPAPTAHLDDRASAS